MDGCYSMLLAPTVGICRCMCDMSWMYKGQLLLALCILSVREVWEIGLTQLIALFSYSCVRTCTLPLRLVLLHAPVAGRRLLEERHSAPGVTATQPLQRPPAPPAQSLSLYYHPCILLHPSHRSMPRRVARYSD